MPASLRAAFGAWGNDRRNRIGTLRDLALYRADLYPVRTSCDFWIDRHLRVMRKFGLLEPAKAWLEDKSLGIAKAMRHLGMKPARPLKHTIKRRSRRRRP